MQRPTLTGVRIRGIRDAEKILHAVFLEILPMTRRRLDDEDRLALRPGNVYVWEERSNNPMEASSLDSIQRFTDGRSWGPSKAREDFLLYFEKEMPNNRTAMLHKQNNIGYVQLVKQTFSAFVDGPANTRKWHINAYYTYDGEESLRFIDDIPILRNLQVPDGKYTSSRASGQRKTTRVTAPRSDAGPSSSRSSPSSSYPDESPTYEGTLSFSPDGISYHQIYPRVLSSSAPPSHTNPQSPSVRLRHPQGSQVLLAPLAYLQNVAPVAREAVDDRALRSFNGGFR
jgi:Gti1/Pac2 family transcription factor